MDLDCVTSNGFAALHFAIFGGNTEIVRDLLAAGADPGLYAKTGSPIQLAKAANQPEICELIEAALASQKEKKHLSQPLMSVAEAGNKSVKKVFIFF